MLCPSRGFARVVRASSMHVHHQSLFIDSVALCSVSASVCSLPHCATFSATLCTDICSSDPSAPTATPATPPIGARTAATCASPAGVSYTLWRLGLDVTVPASPQWVVVDTFDSPVHLDTCTPLLPNIGTAPHPPSSVPKPCPCSLRCSVMPSSFATCRVLLKCRTDRKSTLTMLALSARIGIGTS